ncbi:hypothetical protein [Streptomyces sp. H27-D2]|uniref:hypothetical protein n=1 Tax=Streptomyces sp. H27-D2 TaxID=3046304 RepID=UPI002DB9500B|nr:hypothetical protein [Streptomyces sp. H27-D2]MEC4017433.1 hypothetical protein [Streptomyces sp. H27-D2]
MPAQEPTADAPKSAKRPHGQPTSMRDLLAACAAASAVSTPPESPQESADRADTDRADTDSGEVTARRDVA